MAPRLSLAQIDNLCLISLTALRRAQNQHDPRADARADLAAATVVSPVSMAIAIASGAGPEQRVTALCAAFPCP